MDDFSDMDHLKQQLEDYFANEPKVKIIRAKKREGLIRARLLGKFFYVLFITNNIIKLNTSNNC